MEITGINIIEEDYDNYIIDCDGTLVYTITQWISNEPIPSAINCSNKLIKNQKLCLFFTNTSTKTRKEYASKILSYGIAVENEKVYGSSYVTAHYIKEHHPEIKEIFPFGMTGVVEEMKDVGITSTTIHNKKADAVVAGMDFTLSYPRIEHAFGLLEVLY